MKCKRIIALCIPLLLTGCTKFYSVHKNSIKNNTSNSKVTINTSLKNSSNHVKSSKEQSSIMKKFNDLINSTNVTEQQVFKFVDDNINGLSKENASKFIFGIEYVQNKNYRKRIDSCFSNNIQQKLSKEFLNKQSINIVTDTTNISNIKDLDLKNFLYKILKSGYKIVITEKRYYPAKNYSYLKQYNNYLSDDIKEYINIKSNYSTQIAISNASLTVSWDNIFKQMMTCENFLNKYPSSQKSKNIDQLYLSYATYYLYGLNETPIFNYTNNHIVYSVKESYNNTANSNINSPFVKMMKTYVDILAKNNYILTNEVEHYRKNILSNLYNK